jgi:hypothetical protein
MRLTQTEINIITEEGKRIFGSDAHIFLFGSRTIDSKRGGDIDLLICLSKSMNASIVVRKKVDFLVALDLKLGEQKIDILVGSETDNRLIIQTALKTGIALC